MARGWESKAVEAQMEEAITPDRKPAVYRSPEQQRNAAKLADLRLCRTRVMQQIQASTNPRYVEQMVRAQEHLDRQITAVEAEGKE